MDTKTIRDEISGQPVVIEKPLLKKHVKIGTLLWYYGFTSIGGWDCPAIITQVNAKKEFKVRSLDDMSEQVQWYQADPEKDNSSSRKTMRVVDAKTVKDYLEKRRVHLHSAILDAQKALARAEGALVQFDKIRSKLKLG